MPKRFTMNFIENVLTDRAGKRGKYTDDKLFKMITKRLKKLIEYEGKNVWYVCGEFFIENKTAPMGYEKYDAFNRCDPEHYEASLQIGTLIEVLKSF